MATLEYRAPKMVQSEALHNQLEIATRISSPLTIDDVVEIRTHWVGEHGIAWANRITDSVEERVAVVLKGTPMTEAPVDAVVDPVDTVADLFTILETAVEALKDYLGVVDEDVAEDATQTPTEMNSGSQMESELVEERKVQMENSERITVTAEIRAVTTDDGSLKIAGYAANFGIEADGLNFREKIAKGAFSRSLKSNEPIFLFVNHQMDQLPLASTRSGTLQLLEDDIGLRMEASLDGSNPRSAELVSALGRGDVDKMSFSFRVNPGGESRENGVRTLTDIQLFEVSVVNQPAYSSTDVGLRQADADLDLRRRAIALRVKMASFKK